MGKFKFYLPRILAITFILFISIFALDAFSDPNWPVALFMHLIPSFILIAITLIAWKKEKLGGILFLAIGVAGFLFFHVNDWVVFFLIIFPVLLLGILFFFSKRKNS